MTVLATVLLRAPRVAGAAPFVGARAHAPAGSRSERHLRGGSLTFYLENDVFVGTDREYTHGCGITWIGRDRPASDLDEGPVGRAFALLRHLAPDGPVRNVSVSIRQNIYTPREIARTDLVRDDQPYAGVTFVPLGFHEKGPRGLASLEIDVGVVGPHAYAAQVQRQVHRWLGGREPAGWAHQLRDEFFVNVAVDWRARPVRTPSRSGWGADVVPNLGAALGTVRTSARAGVQVRAGWGLPENFGTYLLQPSCECTYAPRGARPRRLGAHVFAAFEGEAVARDIFLDGNTFVDSHRVARIPWIGRLVAGVGIRVGALRMDYSFVFQTRIFRTQPRGHRFGGVSITWLR